VRDQQKEYRRETRNSHVCSTNIPPCIILVELGTYAVYISSSNQIRTCDSMPTFVLLQFGAAPASFHQLIRSHRIGLSRSSV
jgi:hypothetical protein